MTDKPDNLTRKLVAEAVASGKRDVPLDANPALIALAAVLVGGTPGDITIGFTAPDWSSQGNGVVGGGTIANMLDSAMALAVLSALQPGQTCATISLTVNMQQGAALGNFLATTGVDRLGGRVAFAHARLFDAEQRLIAAATSSLAIIAAR